MSCDATFKSWTSVAGNNEVRPINCVNWYEAYAFCIWDGGFLPSEAEWNYAASGGLEQREYPWGRGLDGSRASYDCLGDGVFGCSATDMLPVGSTPNGSGKWLQQDLAGSLWEWTQDGFGPYASNCQDCMGVTGTESGRVVRGGDSFFGKSGESLRTSLRVSQESDTHAKEMGFRCARPPMSVCSGHGNPAPSGTCICAVGWDGADCNACAPGYGGPRCDSSDAVTCHGHGQVQGDGTCVCTAGYAGPDCSGCTSGLVDSNGTLLGGTCVSLPTNGTTAIACESGTTDSNGVASGGTCVAAPNDGSRSIACDPGYGDSNGAKAQGTCVSFPASCEAPGPGRSECGNDNESCCTSLLVPGGTFNRDNDASRSTTVSDFRLDKFETTVGRFRKFVEAWVAGWRPESGAGRHTHVHGGLGLAATSGGHESGWDTAWATSLGATKAAWDSTLACVSMFPTWTNAPDGNEKLPITCVSHVEAMAFCLWDGGFLPTEAEWNYAASGGSEQRYYPWSKPSESTTISAEYASYGCLSDGVAGCSFADIVPVGSKPLGNGLWGHADLVGNVWEWTLDTTAGFSATCVDCVRTSGGSPSNRVIRSAFVASKALLLRTSWSDEWDPSARNGRIGLRCARRK